MTGQLVEASQQFRLTGGAEVESCCDHEWGSEWHSHLGHPRYGAHAKHWDCTKCGVIKTQPLRESKTYLVPAYMKLYGVVERTPHYCFQGWRGSVVSEEVFDPDGLLEKAKRHNVVNCLIGRHLWGTWAALEGHHNGAPRLYGRLCVKCRKYEKRRMSNEDYWESTPIGEPFEKWPTPATESQRASGMESEEEAEDG